MSWGALPYWMYEVMYQHDLAMMQCAFPAEWNAGLSKHAEKYMYKLHPSVFATHDAGGWNYKPDDELEVLTSIESRV